MFFNQEEKKFLLNRLPPFELSYEPKLHKKVYSSVYYVIPKGPKALVWYTYWKDQHICLLVRINERGNYSDVQVFPSSFSDKMALGTIIYGTYFLHYNKHYFTCEQLHYYKGLHVGGKMYNERLNLLLEMFQTHVGQVAYTPGSLVVGMPVMTDTYENALEVMATLPYKTYGVGSPRDAPKKYVSAASSAALVPAALVPAPAALVPVPAALVPAALVPVPNALVPVPVPAVLATPAPLKRFINKAIFKVKAGLAADNYLLYTANDSLYDTAIISSYKCSVMMNALFRNIKENTNLDLLEESDDEDEFENTEIDKFVDLDKTFHMECVYSKKFKKWQPVKIVSEKVLPTSLKELPLLLKNKI